MKNTIYLLTFCLISFSFLTSCSSDDDSSPDEPTFAELIVGDWSYYQFGEKIDGVVYMEDYESDCEGATDYIEFKASGVVKDNYHNYNCDLVKIDGTYAINGDILTVITDHFGDIETRILKILTLNSTTLKVSEKAEPGDEAEEYIEVYQRM